ncbi:MAG: UDP-galactopyranose mutase [Nocardioides sp.]|nr:UDP-galactopyranose mutase [Nocardioides sp.]
MARAVVVGAGFGGLAAALRLAKLGHTVTLVDSDHELGGALRPVVQDGFTWDGGPSYTGVPAVVRDLFRKTGRPLEAEIGSDLEPLPVVREHRFVDGTTLVLPPGRRPQRDAVEELAPGDGGRWDEHVQSYAATWELLRRHYFEEPWQRDALPREVSAVLDARGDLRKRLRRTFRDDRFVDALAHRHRAEGHDLRDVPPWAGLDAYLEQLFGLWRMPGGMHVLRDLLVDRLATRGVEVAAGTDVLDVAVRDGRAVGVRTTGGDLDADVVVCAVDPRRLPVLRRYVERTLVALPPLVVHLGLVGTPGVEMPDLAHETVLHGDSPLVVRTGGTAPEGHVTWTLHAHGRTAEDLAVTLARAGIDVRDRIVTRVDLSPRDLVERWHGTPNGVLWGGRRTVRQRLGPDTPVPGVLAVGAHATPGAGLPYVGLSAALAATVVGPAS